MVALGGFTSLIALLNPAIFMGRDFGRGELARLHTTDSVHLVVGDPAPVVPLSHNPASLFRTACAHLVRLVPLAAAAAAAALAPPFFPHALHPVMQCAVLLGGTAAVAAQPSGLTLQLVCKKGYVAPVMGRESTAPSFLHYFTPPTNTAVLLRGMKLSLNGMWHALVWMAHQILIFLDFSPSGSYQTFLTYFPGTVEAWGERGLH